MQVYSFLDSIVSLYPEITVLDTSWTSQFQELKIPVLKISDNPEIEEDEPAIGYDGLIHSREPVSLETCLRLIEILLENYGSDVLITQWINNTEIFIIPMLNPDGWDYVCEDWDQNKMWYKNQHDNDTNGYFHPSIDGVNLNRNFDSNWEYGNPNPSSPRYRGAYPFSEKESMIKYNYATANKYVLSINYHSAPSTYQYTESVGVIKTYLNYPNPEYEIIRDIADSIAQRTPKLGSSTEHYIIAEYDCDAGYSDCWMIDKNGTIEFGIETGPELYPTGPEALEIANDNANAGLYLLERVFGPGITGHVSDAITGEPMVAWVKIPDIYDPVIEPKTSDSLYGRFFRILKPGEYTVEVIKEGYETAVFEDVEVYDTLTYLDVQLEILSSAYSQNEIVKRHFSAKNYPNPFTTSTSLSYELKQPDKVTLMIYDYLGKQVYHTQENQPQGKQQLIWNAESYPEGVYYYKLQIGDAVANGKMVKVK
jgi:hypothetical protein